VIRRIVSCYYGQRYTRLAGVLAHSAAVHCPQWEQQIERLPDMARSDYNKAHAHAALPPGAQIAKLAYWQHAIAAAPEGTGLLLIDADTVILRSLNRVWRDEFDVAYTLHDPDYRWPVNCGVIFVRASTRVQAFFEAWELAARANRDGGEERRDWCRRHFGAGDQAAFMQTLETHGHLVQTHALACQEWNCADPEWAHFTAQTRIVHLKGSLRAALFGRSPSPKRAKSIRPLVRLWRQIARDVPEAA
jgi:hypothetical protein